LPAYAPDGRIFAETFVQLSVRAKETLTLNETLIAIADAKYHYNFWRPITAIRNGDLDGN
jgi:hypothetical protein